MFQNMFQQFADNNRSAIIIRQISNGEVVYVSPRYREIWQQPKEDLYQDPHIWMRSLHPEDMDRILRTYRLDGNDFNEEYRIVRPNGEIRWIWGHCFSLNNADGQIDQIALVCEDISDRKRQEYLLAGQSQVLEILASGAELSEILTRLIQMIEIQEPQLRCSILLLEGDRLFHGAAPSFPPNFVNAINGIEIGDRHGSCGAAAYHQKTVIVEDICRDPLWENCRNLALESGFRACWSTPIFTKSGQVLGTLGIYYHEIYLPTDEQIELVRFAVNLASLAIEKKKSETALQESEHRLRASESLLTAMFNKAYVGMTINDLDGKFIKANRFYQEMIGYSESELAAMGFIDNTFPEDIPEHLRLRNLVLSNKCGGYQLEKRLVHRDGHTIWVRTTSSLIIDNQGEKILFGLIENISALKQAEKSLQSLVEGSVAQTGEDFLPTLTEYIANALEVRHVFVTQRRGDNLDLMVSWIDGQLRPKSTISMINTPCSLTIKEGRYFCSEGLQAEFEGSEVAKSLEADSYLGIAIVNSYGETTGSLCIFDDKPIANLQRADAMLRIFAARVSSELERKEAIDKLNQLNQQLESRVALRTDELQSANQQLIETNTDLARATRLKDEFLANMSHELRTPLNAVLGMSEGLRSGVFGELNSRQMRSLSLVETSGRHLLELINDILDVAKIGAGKLELEISPVSLERLCKSSFSFVKQPANQKNIQLKLLIPLNMPMIAIDERRIRQALINLLSNAVKFTAKGGKIALEVEIIKAVRDGAIAQIPDQPDQIIFSVIDTGIGISSENIDKLFQPFVQIDSSLNRQFVGTGLGLTLVKQIAELHGGSVSVTSQIDQGSCFSISLPYNIPIKLAKPNNSAADSPQTQLPVLSNSRVKPNGLIHPLILIVDDNYINIEVFTSYLSSSDYRLIVAHDGQQAVNMVISEKPDLVIMDIQMPVLDGISAIIKIREYPQFQDIPIIAVTALAMIGDREKCLAVGANEYLTKPVNLSQLNSVVKKQLSL